MSDLLKLKKDMEALKAKIQGLEGRKDQLLDRLKEEYGCKTVEEASKKLKELEKEEEALASKLENRLQSFRKRYKDLLENED